MVGLDEKSRREKTSLVAFFSERSILVTGSTGFMGKVLIEKLLRSCPNVREIFLLLRPKKGLSIEERLQQMIDLPLFDLVREQNPSAFKKLIPIHGDVSVEGLDLSEADRQLLIDRVSVIIHVAANVRFDEDLKKDILSNTRSTRDICILGKSIKNLVALVHVSTAYAQCDKQKVEEIVYPQLTDWRSVIQMAETLDDYTVKTITSKYIGTMPNTYTFSKRLAEGVMEDYSKELPILITRPSIVISSVSDPVSGWVDNFNGPVGLLTAGGKGVLRVTGLNEDIAGDYLPVDIAIKAILIATWKRGIKSLAEDPSVHVYNCTSYNLYRLPMKQLITMGLKIVRDDKPLKGSIWYPRVIVVANFHLFYILTLFMHLIPSFFLDGLLQLSGNKPILRRIYTKIYYASMRLKFFMENEWDFENHKMMAGLESVPPSDKEAFFFDYRQFDTRKYYEDAIAGVKNYLFHESLDLESAKRGMRRMLWIDRITTAVVFALLFWISHRNGYLAYIASQFRYVADGSFLNA